MVVEPAVVSTGGISSPVPGRDFIPQVPIDESGIGSLIGVGRPDAAGRGVIPPPPPMITKRNTEEMVGIPMSPIRPSPIRMPSLLEIQEPMIPIGVNALDREGSINIPPPPPPVVRPPMPPPPPPPVATPSVARPVVVDAPPPPPLPIRRPPPLPKPPPTPVNVAKKPTPAVIPEIDLDAIRRRVAEIKPEPKVVLPTPRKGRKPITQAIPTRAKEIPAISTAGALQSALQIQAPPKPNTQQVETKPKTRKKQQPKKRRGRRGARGRG